VNIRELVALARITERQVRYLISEGFMPPPEGGRANANYGETHLTAIHRYNRLRDLGFPPAAIKLMLEAKEGIPFRVTADVTLIIAPGLLNSGTDPEPIVAAIRSLLKDILKETSDADRKPEASA
jgi:MerR family transcriptional regulator, copper efflux regulator